MRTSTKTLIKTPEITRRLIKIWVSNLIARIVTAQLRRQVLRHYKLVSDVNPPLDASYSTAQSEYNFYFSLTTMLLTKEKRMPNQ